MAFWSRLFTRGTHERDAAYRQGARDARQHPLGEFTDPESQPAYVSELRARSRQRVAEIDRGLVARRTALLREAAEARETILRELSRPDVPQANGHRPLPAAGGQDAFISIAEARWRREERRRRDVVRAAGDTLQRARTRIEQLAQEWQSALAEREHAVAATQAEADVLIAAYRSGVMSAHPRREELPPLWKGEVAATTRPPTLTEGTQELGRILQDVEHRIELWHHQVRPALPSPDPEPEPAPPDDHEEGA
ncbi:hypothetical protein ACIBHX_29285 [Nonomuraea sp. NPDC050536]|uniref:hypothetical protein n=1 Tax=Nonomuraea sp. NPDC050536 TaxID=3364366 RepID=UPI0037C6127A